jgi:transcriptional regulator with XRE-family HTH domain
MDGGHTTDPLLALAAKLERRRRSRGMTVESVAERSGLDRAQVKRVLEGRENAGISAMLRLAGALEIDPGELFDGIVWVPVEGGGEYRVEKPEAD